VGKDPLWPGHDCTNSSRAAASGVAAVTTP
jgi:hypothetical protein